MKSKVLWAGVIAVIAGIFLLILVLPGHAFFSTDVIKAKEFMEAGMYPQAIELLNKRVNDKPTDAEAHYQLGMCYLHTWEWGPMLERFDSAVKLKADYGYQIGGKFKQAGDVAYAKGDPGAIAFYRYAVKYQPDLKSVIVKQFFGQGKAFFDSGQYDLADRMFSMATKVDSALKQKICDMYFRLGQEAGDNECKALYGRAIEWGRWHDKEIRERAKEIRERASAIK